MTDSAAAKKISDDYGAKAAEVAAKLKPGTYEAARSLAAVSIAASLARIADQLEQR
ncbi:hypothetical protein KIH74_17590 [Kineosporia sp. J2-2]|uniref:Uncharacterized protein n=1 Tax=Kineosporia corallincola TaxID=2835133 RepID=A0ABS5TI40_9ACTN|nr:hypothetical protein [Kineosporia corallincola]MBT0770760.1 hypothetical protein [Kineosporia corallincola]